MSKLIIENRTGLRDIDAITLVTEVIKQGRITNNGKQYCAYTKMQMGDRNYIVLTAIEGNDDIFIINMESMGELIMKGVESRNAMDKQ